MRPINGGKGGSPVDNNGNLLPAVNEGAYRGFTHILAIGVTITFDQLFGAPRPLHFGNPYERGYVPPAEDANVEKADKARKADKSDTSDEPQKKPDKPAETKPDWGEDLDK